MYVRRRTAELLFVVVGEAENGNSLEAARNVTSWNRNFRHQPALLDSEYPLTHCDADRKKSSSSPSPHSFWRAFISYLSSSGSSSRYCTTQHVYQSGSFLARNHQDYGRRYGNSTHSACMSREWLVVVLLLLVVVVVVVVVCCSSTYLWGLSYHRRHYCIVLYCKAGWVSS